MEQIGVRELRQHASRYLARVERGERFEVTDHGRPVAMVVPITGDAWQDLIDSGQVSGPTHEGDLLDERPRDHGVKASEHLASMRDRER
ncbi:MAG: type II toxin-antitoxin system Phd/YefM family antitoxin [Actinobacteria bacterium]|nr:type II toxin-antitoxin system Phd/YefM family antitoxin [Actinomycetota bacterium]MBI3256598.1 type II toxin-antitoxin system Phd/YefM family antitoxin [Actinomycetota bacterium]